LSGQLNDRLSGLPGNRQNGRLSDRLSALPGNRQNGRLNDRLSDRLSDLGLRR
jgi:hypothetical protein